MLSQLVHLCDERYHNYAECDTCPNSNFCQHNCGECLKATHFSKEALVKRHYDCTKMMDFYVCKYAYRYTSELIYAFSMLQDLKTKENLKVLSLGCGPCTDLLALDYLKQHNEYHFETLDYRGVEINPIIWENIHKDIRNIVKEISGWSFAVFPQDIAQYICEQNMNQWKPDLIVLQYVLSDMCKNMESKEINKVIKIIANYVDQLRNETYIVCNDINLSCSMGGGRECFDSILEKICTNTQYSQNHFFNNSKSNHFEYGVEYDKNDIVMDGLDNNVWLKYLKDNYNLFESCASAQMIIKKVGNNDN